MSLRARLRGDEGASLILALIVVMLISVSGISLLALAGVSNRNTAITRSRINQLYAADGGIETGIETLDADQLDGSPTICAGVAASWSSSFVSTTINGRPVTVTCKTMAGGTTTTTTGGASSLLNGYTAILGSAGLTVSGNTSNGAPATLINGKVYSGGPISAPAAAALRVTGNLEYYLACPPLPANVTLTSPGVCSHPASAPTITAPTVVVPTVTAPASVLKTSDATCRIFYPGKYTTAPAFSGGGNYYLASGTYYFSGPGDVNLLGTIFGGAPGAETKQMTGASPCATDADAHTQTTSYVSTNVGSGVEIIFGGNGVFRTQDPSAVELYTRIPGTAAPDYGATAGVSVWGQAAAIGNYTPGLSNSTPFNTQNKNDPLVIHGLVYMPDSLAQIREPLNPGTGGAGPFMGGMVLKGLILDMDGNTSPDPTEKTIGGTTSTTTTTYPTRTMLLCSIATQAVGGSTAPPTVIETAVQMAATPVVQSWRDLTATTCP